MKEVPKEVRGVVLVLKNEGFEAYLVGGCVRDILMDRTPKDWDITTNATPEQIQAIFPHTFYENAYGTVGVVVEDGEGNPHPDETLRTIEVTPYRTEGTYSDKRRPDVVTFGVSLDEDLARRDFTMNAIAYDPFTETCIDPFDGQGDIGKSLVRAVGDAEKRLNEDLLRALRAVRLATDLGFEIESSTAQAVKDAGLKLGDISAERIRDEFAKLVMTRNPKRGLELLLEYNMLPHILPELSEGVGIDQNQAHSFTVFEHITRTVQAAADKDFPLEVRLAALLHDIAKPHTRAKDQKKNDWSFHGHEVVGSKIAKKRLEKLRFPSVVVEKVVKLVRWHMFFSDTEQITHSAVRRLIRNVGPENVQDLLHLRVCDRIGTGRPKEQPYRLRKYQAMIEEVMRDPISVGMLSMDGKKLMETTGEKPGPRIGWILHALLEEVLDDPIRNAIDYMEKRALELSKLKDSDLKKLGEEGRGAQKEAENKEISKLRSKFHVE